MDFPKKPKDLSPLIRDEHNQLDDSQVNQVTQDLMKKLITEQRAYQKEISFKHCKGDKRDIMLFITICQRNSVNGKVVLSDPVGPGGFEKWSLEDPYGYKVYEYVECEMKANELPMGMSMAGKFLHGCFRAVTNYLARMGAIDRI